VLPLKSSICCLTIYYINGTRLSVHEPVTVSCCDAERSQQQWAWFSCWAFSCCNGLAVGMVEVGVHGRCTATGAARKITAA